MTVTRSPFFTPEGRIAAGSRSSSGATVSADRLTSSPGPAGTSTGSGPMPSETVATAPSTATARATP